MASYLTEIEVDRLQESSLHRFSPYMIAGVSQSQFSIARYTMCIKFNGYFYTYIPTTDELVRDDVLKWVAKLRKPPRTIEKTKSKENRQQSLFRSESSSED